MHKMLSVSDRRRFDDLFEQILDTLPTHILDRLDEIPVILEDEPSTAQLDDLDIDAHSELCGLHWGVPLTERTDQGWGRLPDNIYLFRGPIMRVSGYKYGGDVKEQIRITLLHEIGHHFGLDEDQLDDLGYG